MSNDEVYGLDITYNGEPLCVPTDLEMETLDIMYNGEPFNYALGIDQFVPVVIIF